MDQRIYKYMDDDNAPLGGSLRRLTSSLERNMVMPFSKSERVNRRFWSSDEPNMRRPCAILARDSSVSMSRP